MQVPVHVAIIPDGNRRWARARGKTVYQGHSEGVRIFEEVARHAADRGVQHLSIWGISVDNLKKRSAREVAGLLRIFRREFQKMQHSKDIHDRQIRILVLGRWNEKFPSVVSREIEAAQEVTRHYRKHTLAFLLAYNGTDDMLQAVQGIARTARQQPAYRVTADEIKNHLWTRELPPVDLLIRTAGEPHLSAGFMMWDIADAELYFAKKYWPDFQPKDFDDALAAYSARQRRFGK